MKARAQWLRTNCVSLRADGRKVYDFAGNRFVQAETHQRFAGAVEVLYDLYYALYSRRRTAIVHL
jgi:hypothetical protein